MRSSLALVACLSVVMLASSICQAESSATAADAVSGQTKSSLPRPKKRSTKLRRQTPGRTLANKVARQKPSESAGKKEANSSTADKVTAATYQLEEILGTEGPTDSPSIVVPPSINHHALPSYTVPSNASACDDCCTTAPPCRQLFAEFLFLRPSGAKVPFGIPQDGIGFTGTTPMGAVAEATPDYEPGFRVGASLPLDCDSSLSATYTWFESATNAHVSTAAPNVIQPLVMFPGTFNAGFTAQEASARYDIDFQLVDLDYRAALIACDRYRLNYVLGARYGHLQQDFQADFPFSPPDGMTRVVSQINFDGAGLRAGFDGERPIACGSAFSVYGRGMVNVLAGEFQADYLQTNQFNGTEAITSADDFNIVPILEAELGVAWTSCGGRVRLSAGYSVTAWFNTVTTPEWIRSVQGGNFADASETLTFDGLTAQMEYRF